MLYLLYLIYRKQQNGGQRNRQRSDSDATKTPFSFQRSISETEPVPHTPRKGGFGIPRSNSVPAQDIQMEEPRAHQNTSSCFNNGISHENTEINLRPGTVDNEANIFAKPPPGFIPQRKYSGDRQRSRSNSVSNQFSQLVMQNPTNDVNLDSKCDVHVHCGRVSPGLKLFTNATRQILGDKMGIKRSLSNPGENSGGDSVIANNQLYKELRDSSSSVDIRKRHSSASGSRSSSVSSDRSDVMKRQRHSSERVYMYDEENMPNRNLPDKCPW